MNLARFSSSVVVVSSLGLAVACAVVACSSSSAESGGPGASDDSGAGTSADADGDSDSVLGARDATTAHDAGSEPTDAARSSDDASSADASPADAAAASDAAEPDDASPGDAAAASDAAFDAASLPPALQACGTCMENTCEPQVTACNDDVYCSELLDCTLQSGCLATADGGLSSCVTSCASMDGLTSREVAEATKLLEAMASACTSCLAQCPKPDGGT